MESFQPEGSVLIFEGDIVGKEATKMADGETKGKCKVTQKKTVIMGSKYPIFWYLECVTAK